ncbi:hypothetical protein [Mucilaginibacter sp. L196]|uniref:hypothetical protein n=1 Tax=Mucilaginibacter sp. L196 TaxID=1641870 RepID=UPI00131D9209|nr:hypothetical protein [Mucilaginibacter sp. L196]
MSMHIAYISSSNNAEKPKRLTAQQKLHMKAIQYCPKQRLYEQRKVDKMFAPEMAELEALEKKYLNK